MLLVGALEIIPTYFRGLKVQKANTLPGVANHLLTYANLYYYLNHKVVGDTSSVGDGGRGRRGFGRQPARSRR